jgi:hypothetical protein
MIKEFDPRSSLEDIATQVSMLDDFVGVGEIPLVENRIVQEYGGVIGRRSAAAAARYKTGRRTKDEQRELRNTNRVRHEYLGAVALDLAFRTHDLYEDVDMTKRTVVGYVKDAQEEMVAWDYELRLETSAYERAKRWVAQRPIERIVTPFAISTMANMAVYQVIEKSSEYIDLSVAERGGAFGVTTLLLAAGINSLQRNGPPQIGMAFRDISNESLRTYMLDSLNLKEKGIATPSLEELLKMYAERDLTDSVNKIYRASHDFVIGNRGDLECYVERLLTTAERTLYESYGIDPEEVHKPLRQRVMGRLAFTNS